MKTYLVRLRRIVRRKSAQTIVLKILAKSSKAAKAKAKGFSPHDLSWKRESQHTTEYSSPEISRVREMGEG
jgi:hypothetical protein